jgi:acyl-CoA reductase-like NAD-dependent aldehyde dehydrogenase
MAIAAIPIDSLPSVNPASGRIENYFPITPASALPEILSSARKAQAEWSSRSIKSRCAQISVLRDVLLSAHDALADAVVRESGKPRVEALFADIFVSLDTAAYFARHAENLLRPEAVSHHGTASKAKSGRLTCEPFGVIAIISSWNYPLAIPLSQIIPAIAAGNAVVCKTSDLTPHCGALIEKLFHDAGFPKGLVTVVQGGAETAQALLSAHPDKVLFTGSVVTGRRVAQACAKLLIPSVLELGGKDAMLVLADADLDIAARGALWGSFTNCGQVCLSVERLFVEESVSESFAAKCAEKTKKLRLGPGSDPSSDVGPLIRPHHAQRMQDLLDDAVERGAKILCGGNPRPDLGPNFFEPTVVNNVDSSMKLFQEETFGPILAMQTVRDAEEAIRRANDSPFALAASVWTSDASLGQSIARRLRAGSVMINDAISYFGIAEAPHGGCGASGWGRTHGKAGLMEMVQTKYINVDRLPHREKPWWFRYNPNLEAAAHAFLQFEFGNTLANRLRNARKAMKTMFRDHDL